MIVRTSMKLLLIGIIKNNKRGSFVLAVISCAPTSINIVAHGLPIRLEQVLQAFGEDRQVTETIVETITAQDRGLAVTGSPYFDVVRGSRFRARPEKLARLWRFRHAPTL